MTSSPEDVVSILLVEPDPEDAGLYVDSFADVPTPTAIHTVSDGEGALEFLHRRGEYADSPRPNLVLLPFRLTAVSGEAVLSEVKQESTLKSIPVIVLTRTNADEETRRAYEFHANAALEKPDSPEGVDSLVRAIERFWLGFVKFPTVAP
ncbi:response regulator [Natronorubrum sp. DTA28]|uniref:response regulator n=1 Tax=Natronorubrum sp. DTA28 TaxID=3447019 RepID=UPI003F84BFFA